jgi:hypothetical protein
MKRGCRICMKVGWVLLNWSEPDALRMVQKAESLSGLNRLSQQKGWRGFSPDQENQVVEQSRLTTFDLRRLRSLRL